MTASSSDQPIPPEPQGAPNGDPPAIPGHQLLRRIARGSYGEIWLARTELGAHRAVKIIRRASFTNPKPYDREFAGIQRYEPISREHEGLVDVLQVGRDEAAGFFYYVMELADAASQPLTPSLSPSDGERVASSREKGVSHDHSRTFSPAVYSPLTLACAIHQRQRLPVAEVIELGITLARALEFLHSRRLIHRDIKPSNIIFVGGLAKLADVGLVADLDGPQTLVGTEGYIPPEGPGTVQADIYSLGKVLYEAATGKDRQEFPDLGLQLGEQADPAMLELNEVLLRACESDRRARYHSAIAMAEDLERIKAGQSLRSRRMRRRWLRLTVTGAAVLAGLAAVFGGGITFVQYKGSQPRLLFRESFDSPGPDTNRWAFGHQEWLGTTGLGRPSFQIEQTGGELILRAEAEHTDGNSTGQKLWAELREDLRSQTPCQVEVEMTAKSLEGFLKIVFSSEGSPPHFDNLPGVELARFDPLERETNIWPTQRLRLDLLPGGQAGIIYRDTNRLDEFDVLDLRATRLLQPRFYAYARTSRGMPPALAEFRLKEVVAFTGPRQALAVGRVIESPSNWALADVVVRDRRGRVLAKTGENGAFAVPLDRSAGPLTFEKEGYTLGSANEPGRLVPNRVTTVTLRNSKPRFGTVVDSIPLNGRTVASVGFRGSALTVLVHNSDTNCSLVQVDLTTRRLPPSGTLETSFNCEKSRLIGEFAECGNRLIGLMRWHGAIVDLSFGEVQLVKELKHTDGSLLSLPHGAAFDGKLFWFVEHDSSIKEFGIRAFDLERQEIVHWLESADRTIAGIAWDGNRFWISNGSGLVYEVDREVALRLGRVDVARLRQFRGNYSRLAFGQDHLWGLDQNARVIHKIKIKD